MRFLYILRYLCGLFWLTQFSFLASGQAPDVTAPRATLLLGAGQPLEVRTETSQATGLVLRVGSLRVPLPLREVTAISTETVSLKGGVGVGLVRLSAANAQSAVLVVNRATKLESLWVGRLDFTGDPGERRADVVQVADQDADGHPDIVVGQYDENVAVCGQQRTLLSPRAVDPKTLTLRAVLLNRYGQRAQTLQLAAASTAPTSLEPPALLRALMPISASSAADAPHDLAALTDADLRSAWQEGRGLGGRFEFATLRWSAPARPIVALAIVPLAEGSAPDVHRARVKSLALLGPNQERWTVTLPDDVHAGSRYWITPPAPITWPCLTIAIDGLHPGSQPTAQTHASLAEIEAYTDLDTQGGIPKLLQELALPGAPGDDATTLLMRARGDVVGTVTDAWPKLPSIGKLRALRVLFQAPGAPDPRAEPTLRSALRDADPEVASAAFKLAAGKLSYGPALVAELARSSGRRGDLAAQQIGRSKRKDALTTLLGILREPGAPARPALRMATAEAYRSAPPEGRAALDAWVATGPDSPPVAARAALALALSQTPEGQPVAAELVGALTSEVREFADQWRVIQAARSLPSDPRGDEFLQTLAQHADTWMLRSSALEALTQRKAPNLQQVALHALDDAYPRVRVSAVAALSTLPSALELLGPKARSDKWFLVRRAVLDELPDSPAARDWFVSSLADPIAVVRASAVHALARVGATEAWPKIDPALQNPEEYPEVIAEAIAFSRALCVHAAGPSLRQVVSRGLKPEAWSADQELALSALETLSTFGGEDAAWAQKHASSPVVPKEVQLAAAAAAKRPPTCTAEGPAL